MASWVWAVLVLVIVFNVVQRYVFGIGAIWLEEVQWHIYGVGFIIGLSYAVTADRHVRVDVLAERWGARTKAWVEFFGIAVLLLPFIIAILAAGVPFVETSYAHNERSSAPGGLPFRWVIKSFILWGFGLLFIAALARLLRCMALLFGWPKPIWPRG
jgi:TRAP-type mannitol/chloroaromatic compound transport system permease small subunit